MEQITGLLPTKNVTTNFFRNFLSRAKHFRTSLCHAQHEYLYFLKNIGAEG